MDVPVYFQPEPEPDLDEEAVLVALVPRFCLRCGGRHGRALECPIRVARDRVPMVPIHIVQSPEGHDALRYMVDSVLLTRRRR